MGLHYQVKPKWVSSSLKGKIGCQKIFTGVWTGLCGNLLSGRENDICVGPCVIGSDIPLATSSVGHKNVFLNDIFDE